MFKDHFPSQSAENHDEKHAHLHVLTASIQNDYSLTPLAVQGYSVPESPISNFLLPHFFSPCLSIEWILPLTVLEIWAINLSAFALVFPSYKCVNCTNQVVVIIIIIYFLYSDALTSGDTCPWRNCQEPQGIHREKKQFSHSALCGSNQSFCSLDPHHLSFLTFTLYDILFYLQQARAGAAPVPWHPLKLLKLANAKPTYSILIVPFQGNHSEGFPAPRLISPQDKCLLLCELSLPSFMNNCKSYVWEHESTLRLTFQSFSEWSLEQHSNSEENHRGASCFCCRVT